MVTTRATTTCTASTRGDACAATDILPRCFPTTLAEKVTSVADSRSPSAVLPLRRGGPRVQALSVPPTRPVRVLIVRRTSLEEREAPRDRQLPAAAAHHAAVVDTSLLVTVASPFRPSPDRLRSHTYDSLSPRRSNLKEQRLEMKLFNVELSKTLHRRRRPRTLARTPETVADKKVAYHLQTIGSRNVSTRPSQTYFHVHRR